MNNKHFVINPSKAKISKKDIADIEFRHQSELKKQAELVEKLSAEKIKQKVGLKHTHGRVIISVDMESKNSHTFQNGQKIFIGRQFNNFNRRETHPVNAFVIDAENIPAGSEILIHPNSTQDSYKIFNFDDELSDVRYYSIPEQECYLWKDGENWMPLKGYATGLRVFVPYKGIIDGIPNDLIKNVLYITSGEFKGKVVQTLKSCDYEIIFMGAKGVEERVIRCRHFEDEWNEREEIVGVDEYLTEQVNKGELLIGISEDKSKTLIPCQ
jgi:hypothetical protein